MLLAGEGGICVEMRWVETIQQHCQESLPHISEHAVKIFIRQQVEFKVAESPAHNKICFSSTSLSQTPSSKADLCLLGPTAEHKTKDFQTCLCCNW